MCPGGTSARGGSGGGRQGGEADRAHQGSPGPRPMWVQGYCATPLATACLVVMSLCCHNNRHPPQPSALDGSVWPWEPALTGGVDVCPSWDRTGSLGPSPTLTRPAGLVALTAWHRTGYLVRLMPPANTVKVRAAWRQKLRSACRPLRLMRMALGSDRRSGEALSCRAAAGPAGGQEGSGGSVPTLRPRHGLWLWPWPGLTAVDSQPCLRLRCCPMLDPLMSPTCS